MSDPGYQHWEAEMDYIGDMLGLDDKHTADDKGSTESQNEHSDEELAVVPEQEWEDPTDRGTRPEYIENTAEITDELREMAAASPVPEKATIPEGNVENMYQLVSVAGIKVAIPLLAIRHVLDNEAEPASGQLEHMGSEYRVVDLHGLFRPGEQASAGAYMLIEDRGIALACERVLDMVSIEKVEVCWRDDSSQRNWLSGTIKNKGIALVELDQL